MLIHRIALGCAELIAGQISGSHGGEYEDGCLLGCCTMMIIRMMMEAASTSETSVNFYQTT
jgi:hypothetical protein